MPSTTSIIIQSISLFCSTSIVVYYILKVAGSNSFKLSNNNIPFDKKKAFTYSILFSIVFTLFMTFISYQTDKQLVKNVKNNFIK
jgi:hypothetical protein